jgi:phage portal protein BeeE
MGLRDLFRRSGEKRETRAAGTGFTAQIVEARDSYIAGRSGVAELTGTVTGCVNLWEAGLGLADVEGTDLLDSTSLGIMARGLALRGEAVFLIRDRLVPASDWTLTTRDGIPTAYKLTISEAGGGRTVTALASEVLHVTVGTDSVTPWAGTPPLRQASLTAGLLHAVEAALSDVYANAPIGSLIAPYPESTDVDRQQLARSFRGQRGRVLLRESVNVAAAGGPTPQTDWKTSDLSPDLQRAMTAESLDAARNSIAWAYGVLPAMLDPKAPGNTVREGQRHLAQWSLEPIARRIADEASVKLEEEVTLDVLRPLQAYDAGQRARAMKGTLEGLALAKQAGMTDDQIAAVLRFAGMEGTGE